jgi:hypothetical protein
MKIKTKWMLLILFLIVGILYFLNTFMLNNYHTLTLSNNYQNHSLSQIYKTESFNGIEVQYQTEDIYRTVKNNPSFLGSLSNWSINDLMSEKDGPIEIGHDESGYFVRGQTTHIWSSENQDFEEAINDYLNEVRSKQMFRNDMDKKFSLSVTSVTWNLYGITFKYKRENVQYFLGSVESVTLEDRGNQEFYFKEGLNTSWYYVNESDLMERFDIAFKASDIISNQSLYAIEDAYQIFDVNDIKSGIVKLSAKRDYKEGEKHDYMQMGAMAGGRTVEIPYKRVNLEIDLNKETISEI